MSKMKFTLTLWLSGCALFLSAQDNFVVENVRLFDGNTVQEDMYISVVDGKVSEISNSKIEIKSAIRIDGSDKTLIPALTNAHVHAWMPNNLKDAAKAGVLNVLDMHGVEMAQGMMRVFKDSTNYANYYAAGAAATAPDGHGTQFGFPTPTLTKPQEAKQFIQDRVKNNADYIKIILEPWKATLTLETVNELIKEAHHANKVAVVHISRLEDATHVLKNDADGLVHIWWDKTLDALELKALSDSKDFFVIPTLLTTLRIFKTMNTKADQFLNKEQLLKEVKKMYDVGIPILAGTDPPNAGINYGTDLYLEMKLFAEAGISNLDVLKSATSNISKAFNIEDFGFISEGKPADMILIDGNPLQDVSVIKNINTVWKYGRKVK